MTGNVSDEVRPWLGELIERYGEPRVHAGPVPTVIHDPNYADDRGVLVQQAMELLQRVVAIGSEDAIWDELADYFRAWISGRDDGEPGR